jgi:hypothetical protein
MGGQYNLYQPKDDAEGDHLEFKCHCRPNAGCEVTVTIASPEVNGVDAPEHSAQDGGAPCDRLADFSSVGRGFESRNRHEETQ